MNPMSVFWLVLLILFLAAEGATAAVTTIWFAAGALVAMVTAFLGGQLWLQICLFILVSIALLLALRPILKKYITPRRVKTNIDALVGAQGIVTVQIDNLRSTGKIKLNGMEWTARSGDGSQIPVGAVVRVEKIEGVKAIVTLQSAPCATPKA